MAEQHIQNYNIQGFSSIEIGKSDTTYQIPQSRSTPYLLSLFGLLAGDEDRRNERRFDSVRGVPGILCMMLELGVPAPRSR